MNSISRYNLANFTKNGDSFGSTFIKMLNDSPHKVYIKVPQNCQYRPDLLSRMYYGTPNLMWIFYVMNSITNINALTEGKLLLAIPKNELDSLYIRWKHTHGRNS